MAQQSVSNPSNVDELSELNSGEEIRLCVSMKVGRLTDDKEVGLWFHYRKSGKNFCNLVKYFITPLFYA